MSRFLIGANIAAALLLGLTFLYHGSPSSKGHAGSPCRQVSANAASEGGTADTLESVRRRINRKLRSEYLAKFKDSIANSNGMFWPYTYVDKIQVYHDYSALFRKLELTETRTDRLAALLLYRNITMTYFTGAPPEAVESGVATSFSFGAAEFEAQIRAEFGDAVYSAIKAYDTELPSRREEMELSDVLNTIGRRPDSTMAGELTEMLKENPRPAEPQGVDSRSEWDDYNRNKAARMRATLDWVSSAVGDDARTLVGQYLLDKEEVAQAVNALKAAEKAGKFRAR